MFIGLANVSQAKQGIHIMAYTTIVVAASRSLFGCLFEAMQNREGFWYYREAFEGYHGKQWTKWTELKDGQIYRDEVTKQICFDGMNCFVQVVETNNRLPKGGTIKVVNALSVIA